MAISKKPNLSQINKVAAKAKNGAAKRGGGEKNTKKSTSFLLREIDKTRLRQIALAATAECGQKISSAAVIRGLLFLGEKTSAKKMVKMIRDAAY